ncbi:MAG: hypothetical protein JW963_12865 [Anaerolineales bacterium]|nr:hypothetical protein [Anaerolineales bacterium]
MNRWQTYVATLVVLLVIYFIWQDIAGGNLIITITRELDLVKAGPVDSMEVVYDSRVLNNNEGVKVTDGGLAILVFEECSEFKIFNESEVVNIELVKEGKSRRCLAKLERGGLSGEVVEKKSSFDLRALIGTRIIISGTNFFVVYDDAMEFLTVGKYDGRLEIAIPGQDEFELPDNTMADIASDGSIAFYPILFDQETFESNAQNHNSAIDGLNTLREEPTLAPTEAPAVEEIIVTEEPAVEEAPAEPAQE